MPVRSWINWRGALAFVSAPFVRYVAAGGVGTTLHYLTLTLVIECLGGRADVATAIGALVGAGVNYVINYHFTFASKAPHHRTLPRFFVIAALSATINGVLMSFLTSLLHVHYLLAQVGCTGVFLVVGFLLNKAWTFRAPAEQGDRVPRPRAKLPEESVGASN